MTTNRRLEYLGDISEEFAIFTYQQGDLDYNKTHDSYYKICHQHYVVINKEDMVSSNIQSHRDLMHFIIKCNVYAQSDIDITRDLNKLTADQLVKLEQLVSIHKVLTT